MREKEVKRKKQAWRSMAGSPKKQKNKSYFLYRTYFHKQFYLCPLSDLISFMRLLPDQLNLT